jgi:N utilization substance protein B
MCPGRVGNGAIIATDQSGFWRDTDGRQLWPEHTRGTEGEIVSTPRPRNTSDRRNARIVVVQILYQDDLNPQHSPVWDEDLIKRRLRHPQLVAFAQSLLAGVRLHQTELDAKLAAVTENWSLSRMAITDRNVLRLGAYELLYSDTPPRVVIDEAVELAKLFGTQQSGQFVNGILDRLYRDIVSHHGTSVESS